MSSVTVIIPCYNAEPFIGEALQSVLAQERPPDDVIVVDDCSTDGSAAVARGFGVRVLRTPGNAGHGAARNLALRAAGTELVAWLDADDVWEPHHLATVVPILERYPEAAVAFGGTRRFGTRTGDVLGYVPPGEPRDVFWEAFDDWIHTMISAVCRRDALLEIGGFDETERCSVDYDLWLRLARRYPFASTHRITARWRWHPGQMSSAPARQWKAVYRFRRRLWEQLHREGEVERADQVRTRSWELLDAALRHSWYHRDLAAVRSFAGMIATVPYSPVRSRLRWAARARTPAAVLWAYDALRGRHHGPAARARRRMRSRANIAQCRGVSAKCCGASRPPPRGEVVAAQSLARREQPPARGTIAARAAGWARYPSHERR